MLMGRSPGTLTLEWSLARNFPTGRRNAKLTFRSAERAVWRSTSSRLFGEREFGTNWRTAARMTTLQGKTRLAALSRHGLQNKQNALELPVRAESEINVIGRNPVDFYRSVAYVDRSAEGT